MRTLIVLLFTSSSLVLSSCMHLIMTDGHSDHQADPLVERQVVIGADEVVVTVPPLELKKESNITLRLRQALPGDFEDRVRAFVLFKGKEQHMSGHKSGMHSEDAPHHGDATTEVDQLVEADKSGVYSYRFTPSQQGVYEVGFTIESLGGEIHKPPMIVTTERFVSAKQRRGMDSMMTYGAVGIVLMGIMMLTMASIF